MAQNNSNNFYKTPFLFSFLLAIIAGIFILATGKFESFQLINSHHNSFFDFFFRYYTFLGDGLLWIPFFLFTLARKKEWVWVVLLSFLISSVLAQLLKRVVFPEELRPISFLTAQFQVHFVEGVTLHHRYSFPSGHTVSAFTIAILLSFQLRNKIGFYLLPLMAFFVGYSRVYLAQHFATDVLGGILIGILAAVLSIFIIKKSRYSRDF
ncbi:MAG: phosphatase PAP2 family protein [Chitinophagaceae bacterium]|nr:MAG: phosphatase PAP2 family protein [Chitinophagaceae bacterium]